MRKFGSPLYSSIPETFMVKSLKTLQPVASVRSRTRCPSKGMRWLMIGKLRLLEQKIRWICLALDCCCIRLRVLNERKCHCISLTLECRVILWSCLVSCKFSVNNCLVTVSRRWSPGCCKEIILKCCEHSSRESRKCYFCCLLRVIKLWIICYKSYFQ